MASSVWSTQRAASAELAQTNGERASPCHSTSNRSHSRPAPKGSASTSAFSPPRTSCMGGNGRPAGGRATLACVPGLAHQHRLWATVASSSGAGSAPSPTLLCPAARAASRHRPSVVRPAAAPHTCAPQVHPSTAPAGAPHLHDRAQPPLAGAGAAVIVPVYLEAGQGRAGQA